MKLIPLTQGKFAMVDDEDYEWLSAWKWCYHQTGYAVRNEVHRKNDSYLLIRMHREILRVPRDAFVDHKNGNTLDNQKTNLRQATKAQNQHNSKKRKNGKTSIYKGVSLNSKDGKFKAYISSNWKSIFLGSFNSEIEAAIAYNQGAIKYHGEFARLNEVA